MLSMIFKRLLLAVPSLIGVVIVTFLLTRALPGDPAAYFAGPAATKEAVEQVRVKLGLDKPLLVQFVRYVGFVAAVCRPVSDGCATCVAGKPPTIGASVTSGRCLSLKFPAGSQIILIPRSNNC